MNFTTQSKKLLLLFLSFFTTIVSAHQDIILKNIYHHRGVPQPNQLELGSVVFYFSAKPVIKRISSQVISNAVTKDTYSMNGVHFQKDAKPLLPIVSKHYSVALQTVGDALQLVITYDPHKVAIEFDTFDSISLQKGVAIHFLNCNAASQQVALKQSTTLSKKKNNKPAVDSTSSVHPEPVEGRQTGNAMAGKQKTIIIDCGHGGSDAGATGCFGIKEKDIVLSVGLRVAQLLQKAGMRVLLTRSSDVSMALDERTSFANYHNADVFISIHANYAQNVSAQGIDTFCMHVPLLHRENNLSVNTRSHIPCGSVLSALTKARADESNKLAHMVHESVITKVKNNYPTVVDRKVKHEVAQILLGSHMPAILIELGFISHEEEAKRLRDQRYQNLLACSISSGITAYLKE